VSRLRADDVVGACGGAREGDRSPRSEAREHPDYEVRLAKIADSGLPKLVESSAADVSQGSTFDRRPHVQEEGTSFSDAIVWGNESSRLLESLDRLDQGIPDAGDVDYAWQAGITERLEYPRHKVPFELTDLFGITVQY
jgi:hypothetical protein